MAAVDDLNSIADAWLEGEEIESRIKQATDKVAAAQAAATAGGAAVKEEMQQAVQAKGGRKGGGRKGKW